MSLVIKNATIIDGVADRPMEGKSLWIQGNRIKAIAGEDELSLSPATTTIDARGKYIIPGLIDGNVHFLQDMRLEHLVRHESQYEDVILEAAQIALRSGVTTAFDTWGPRRPLVALRERINAGGVPGTRMFCAGNIVGLDGPISADFIHKAAEIASPAQIERINALWVENVGPALSWMTPCQVAKEIRAYIAKGVDFIKYASSEHRWATTTSFLVFSPAVQAAIVEEVHQTGLTVQAHTTSVESLRVAVEAGCDLIQHPNLTGPVPIPDETLELMAKRSTAAAVFPFTRRRRDWMLRKGDGISGVFSASTVDINIHNLIKAGAKFVMATDGGIWGRDAASDPFWAAAITGEDNLIELGQGHFHWLVAMEEMGLPSLQILRAATYDVAAAYGKGKDLGTIEPGKIADLIILDRNPLQSAENYRSIHKILKDGVDIDRSLLPQSPILTMPAGEPSPEVLAYRAHRRAGDSARPFCC
ncbi:amidohydrolase family protein [Steroidobacter agaridevorans]|uniref:amidohydrolase family protein n=1 Tax=Steroidobacter agaridevorans TaxID=2695856 RepID=UPI001328AA00|nr:amidohydrolase family protein [Steroidobacter agaridevorans]GFE91909.1 Xaa-Pro dipeptidase [Steroidobacter agaridevorans]